MTTTTPPASQTASADAGEGQMLTVETVRKWKERAERRFMISSLDEYCPDEFLELADAYIALAALRQTSSEPVARDYPSEFEAWWSGYRHRNREPADYSTKKQIAFDAFYFGARAAPTEPEHAASERVRVLEEALRLARGYLEHCLPDAEFNEDEDTVAAIKGDLSFIDAALNPHPQEKGV